MIHVPQKPEVLTSSMASTTDMWTTGIMISVCANVRELSILRGSGPEQADTL